MTTNPPLITTSENRRARLGPPASAAWRLEAGELALWRADLDALSSPCLAACGGVLSTDETARAQRFFFERDRRRAVASRGVLRFLLAAYTGRQAAGLQLVYGVNGKPALASDAAPGIFFNVTHAEGLALYAFTHVGEVGIDAERVRPLPDWEAICSTCFTSTEAARIQAAAPAARPMEFLRAWTRHEARLKARGVGLTGDVASADPRCGTVAAAASDAPAWRVHPVNPGCGYVAAVAAPAATRFATCRHWTGHAVAPRFAAAARQLLFDQPSTSELSFP